MSRLSLVWVRFQPTDTNTSPKILFSPILSHVAVVEKNKVETFASISKYFTSCILLANAAPICIFFHFEEGSNSIPMHSGRTLTRMVAPQWKKRSFTFGVTCIPVTASV